MDALIDELAAAGKRGVGAPLLVVADAAAVPVATAHEHQLAEDAGVEQLAGFLERRMIPMVEPDAHQPLTSPRGRVDHSVDLRHRAAAGFSTDHVLARATAARRDLRQHLVGRRDDDDVDVGAVDRGPPVVGGDRTGRRAASASARSRSMSAQATSRAPPSAAGALPTDQAAADDGDAQDSFSAPL